jgi:tetratricopeptide (TPR) repeat protein
MKALATSSERLIFRVIISHIISEILQASRAANAAWLSLTSLGSEGIITAMSIKQKLILIAGLAGIITFLVFLPCLGNGFTNWDDQELVTGNPNITALNLKNILTIFTRPYVGTYIPLTILTFAVEYHFFRLNPFFYHLTNIFLHAANVALALVLVYLLSGNLYAAAAVALLFGLHPLRVESVAWVTERKDVLYGFFYLGALLSYLRYRRLKVKPFYIAALILFVMAVLAKPMAITLPLVLILLDYYLEGKIVRSGLVRIVPFLILALPLGIVNIFAQQSMENPPFNLFLNFLIGSYNFVFYTAKTFFPANLSCLYPYPNHDLRTIPIILYLSPFLLLALGLIVVWSGRRSRHLIFGTLFFVIGLLPVCQFIPMIGAAIAADRYTYLPSLGIFYLLGIAGLWLGRRILKESRVGRITAGAAVGSVLLILAVMTGLRCRVWKDSITLWNDVLRKYPENSLALNNRGRAYASLKQYQTAIKDYDRSIAVDPQYELPYYNRAVAYDNLEEYDRALIDYGRALAIKPDLAIAYESRGVTYNHRGEYEKAIADFNQALKINPTMAVAYNDRGIAYFNLKQFELALADYKRTLKLEPSFFEAYINQGDVHFFRGEYDQAVADYSRGLAIQPAYPSAYYNRGVAYKALGEYDKALADYNRTLEIKPDFAEAYNNRGNLYLDLGEYEQAISDYDQALRFRPDYGEALYNRAVAYYTLNDFHRAWDDLRKIKELGFKGDPKFTDLVIRALGGEK